VRILVRHITHKTKGGATHQDQLLTGSRLSLGRGTDQDIHLPNLRVALAHAELFEGPDGRIRLQSGIASGFRYNGSAVQSAVIAPGDRVEIGAFELVFGTAPGADLGIDITENTAAGGREMEDALLARSRLDLGAAGLRRRPLALGLAGTIAVLFLLVPLLAAVFEPVGHLLRGLPLVPSDHAWSSGEVSQAHAHIAQRCEACHSTPFVPTRNDACLACHQRTPHHVEQPLLDAGLFEDFRCGSCHHEHTGKASIVRRDEGLCVDCHEDLKSVVADTSLENAAHFGDAHPQFKPAILRQVGDRPLELRVSIDDPKELREQPNLEFPHDVHLKPEGLKRPDRGTVRLDCADCHQVEPGGGRMQPIAFERHCHDCHRLAIPGDRDREAPHGDLAAALAAIDDYFAAWALLGGYPNEFAPESVQLRRRPGRELTQAERRDALAWAEDMARTAKSEMLGYTTCGVCHKAEPAGGEGADAWKLAPVNIPYAWYPKSRFSHEQHATQACGDCHAGAAKSQTSADVNLPGIETCRSCHGGANAGAGQLASTCITCHEFHRAREARVMASGEVARVSASSPAANDAGEAR
jgi:predicted CXXCH cytochrome family protein